MAARTISDIQPIVAELAQKYGAQRIYLFGSYARGDMNETRACLKNKYCTKRISVQK